MNAPTNDLLERTLAATTRARETTLASGVGAVGGCLLLLQAGQFLFWFEVNRRFGVVVGILLLFGVAEIVLASKLYAQRAWAAVAATVAAGVMAAALGFAVWWYRRVNALLPPLTHLLPYAQGVAAATAAAAIGPCRRTTAAHRRAAAAGLDLDL